MSKVMPGRFTAQVEGPFVVFVIGMRVNRLWQFWKWLPVVAAMGPMLKTLYQHREKGFLGAELGLIWRGVWLVQYWRSFDDLETFARSADEPHLEPWRRFNQRVGSNGSVGIFHETYLVAAGQYEAVYGNMPVFGLARATQHVPAVGRKETARRRLGLEGEPAVPSPPQPEPQPQDP